MIQPTIQEELPMKNLTRIPNYLILMLAGVLLMLFVACNLGDLSLPEVQNYPQPTMHVSTEAAWETGCAPAGDSNLCAAESPLGSLGCERLQQPGDMLGGLDPSYPIQLCQARREPGEAVDPSTYIYREGCLVKFYIRYAIWRNDQFEVIESQQELSSIYAPIDSPEEALSYALASTGLGVRYGIEPVGGYRYFVDQLQDTYVQEIENGFLVLLYDYHLCGCGPHPTYAVVVQVNRDGQVQEIERQEVYEDPAEDDLCVD
jgi:hypothetical protein